MLPLAFALLAAQPADVPSPAVAPAPPALTVDVPAGPAQQVQLLERTFAPGGGGAGWHTHPGVEIAYVLRGAIDVTVGTGAPTHYAAGDRFLIPSRAVHDAVNHGTVPATLLITLVIDAGAPIRTVVPPPR